MVCERCGSEMVDGSCPKCGKITDPQGDNIQNSVYQMPYENRSVETGYDPIPNNEKTESNNAGIVAVYIILVAAVVVIFALIINSVSKNSVNLDFSSVKNKFSSFQDSLDSIKYNSAEESYSYEDNTIENNVYDNYDETRQISRVAKAIDQVIYDKDGIKITCTQFLEASYPENAELKFDIENNSSQDIILSNDSLVVNGYDFSAWFYETVSAGETVSGVMEFIPDSLEKDDITKIGNVVVSFKATDMDTYDELFRTEKAEIVIRENVTQNENTENYKLLIDEAGVAVYYKDNGVRQSGSEYLRFLIVNNSDTDITIFAEDVEANGKQIDSSMTLVCSSKKKTNEYLLFLKDEMDKNKIDKLEKVSFKLRCYENENYSSLWDSDTIEVSVE